jgi:AcrR family transcriptional regulator
MGEVVPGGGRRACLRGVLTGRRRFPQAAPRALSSVSSWKWEVPWEQMASQRDERDEKDRLHGALVDLCFERGFRNVELWALFDRARLDRAAFDRHFADLEDCFFRVFEVEVDRYRSEYAPAAEELAGWRERVRATLYALYRFIAADRRRARFVVVDSQVAGERTRLLSGRLIEALFDLIDEGRAELENPDALSRATAEAVGGGILNQVYAAVARPIRLPAEEELVPELMYCVVLPYSGLDAALEELYIPPPPNSATPSPLATRRG